MPISRTALGLGLALALAAPAAAQAAPVNDSASLNLTSQSHDIGSYRVAGEHDFEFAWTFYDVNVSARATWTGNLPLATGWNSDNVRQGATLPVGRAAPMLQTGKLRVSWKLNGHIYSGLFGRDVDETIADDASCAPQLIGSTYECTAETPSISLLRATGVPAGPYINLKLKARFVITPEGAIVSRSLTTAGFAPVNKSGLPLTPVGAIDNVKVPCALAGSPAAYKLGPLHWTPAVAVTQQPRLEIGLMDAVFGQVEMPAFSDKAYGNPVKTNPAFDLTSSGRTAALGNLLPNNVAPAIAPMTFSAQAGVAKHLTADVSARCDIASFVWTFSDGTVAYGERPVKTFTKSVTGQLKVTDTSGLSATRDFSVSMPLY
jgi:hypothetical protein